MWPLSSLHTSNFRRRAAFDLQQEGGRDRVAQCPQGLSALTTHPRALRHPHAKLRLDVTARVSQPCLSGARLPAPTSGENSPE